MVIENKLGLAPEVYRTAQVKPYIEYSEDVAVDFILSLNRTIVGYRDVDDNDIQHSSTSKSVESTEGSEGFHAKRSQSTKREPPNTNILNELEKPVHEAFSMGLSEIIQVGGSARERSVNLEGNCR